MNVKRPRHHITLALLVGVAMLTSGCPEVRERQLPTGPHFKLLTYNVNWGGVGRERILTAILTANADIVCLQETTPDWERFLRPELSRKYPHILFRHWRGAGGLAFLSKQPIEEKAYVTRKAGWFPGWIIITNTPIGRVQVMNVHLRPPLSDRGSASIGSYYSTRDVRLREVKDMSRHLALGLPTIVAGDFNEREAFPAVSWLREQGMTDALSQFDRYSPTWKWPVASGAIELKARYDHILYSPHLRSLSARVLGVRASDHYPVVGVFERVE